MASHPSGGKVSPEATTDPARMGVDNNTGGEPPVVLVNYNRNGPAAGGGDESKVAVAVTKTSADNQPAMNDVHGGEEYHADKHDQEPLWICKIMVDHPRKAFGEFQRLHVGTSIWVREFRGRRCF